VSYPTLQCNVDDVVHMPSGNVVRVLAIDGEWCTVERVACADGPSFRRIVGDWWGKVEWHLSSLQGEILPPDVRAYYGL
jgi:hypothetical protein